MHVRFVSRMCPLWTVSDCAPGTLDIARLEVALAKTMRAYNVVIYSVIIKLIRSSPRKSSFNFDNRLATRNLSEPGKLT